MAPGRALFPATEPACAGTPESHASRVYIDSYNLIGIRLRVVGRVQICGWVDTGPQGSMAGRTKKCDQACIIWESGITKFARERHSGIKGNRYEQIDVRVRQNGGAARELTVRQIFHGAGVASRWKRCKSGYITSK